MLFNELDVLELRLNELNNSVCPDPPLIHAHPSTRHLRELATSACLQSSIPHVHVEQLILARQVYRFVLVEATRTHSGNPKPLYYALNAARFAAFQDKIVHLIVDDLPEHTNPWVLEK